VAAASLFVTMRSSGSRNRSTSKSVDWVRVAVVGAGPAGLAVSSRLAGTRCRHVVLERGRVGWSWRTQRWDSFRLNTPQWMNLVPGTSQLGSREAFATAASLVGGLERLAAGLPVAEGTEVFRARRNGDLWRLETSAGVVVASSVVVASGFQNVPRRPAYADALPGDLRQLHAADYRRPEELDGSVLVVGGGQSGLQIAEDVLDAGHRVYLATSRVGRLPRRHRGRDAFAWMRDAGQLDLPREQAESTVISATPPQISGAGGGRTVSYQHLASRGAMLLGHAVGCHGRRLELAPDLGANVRFADEASARSRAAWDTWAAAAGFEAGPHGPSDAADDPASHLYGLRGPESLDLAAAGISTVIWATGFGPSLGWLPPGALDTRGRPQLPGLHVVGAPWLTHRSSANLYGMAADAEQVAALFATECAVAAAA
jgi:putative flavoprotein involved in K+ transport